MRKESHMDWVPVEKVWAEVSLAPSRRTLVVNFPARVNPDRRSCSDTNLKRVMKIIAINDLLSTHSIQASVAALWM